MRPVTASSVITAPLCGDAGERGDGDRFVDQWIRDRAECIRDHEESRQRGDHRAEAMLRRGVHRREQGAPVAARLPMAGLFVRRRVGVAQRPRQTPAIGRALPYDGKARATDQFLGAIALALMECVLTGLDRAETRYRIDPE